MGYVFQGFFCGFDARIPIEARKQWPQAAVQIIRKPFYGIGLRMPDAETLDVDLEDEEVWEAITHAIFEQRDNLPVWSRNFPDVGFVYIFVECFGGICDYAGYSCKNGEKLLSCQGDHSILKALFESINIDLKTTLPFPPFDRSFPWGASF